MTEKNDLKQEMQEQIINLAKSFEDSPEELLEYLKFSTKFYNYSTRNNMLIYQQNKGASYCNSFKGFNDMGYSIKKGEHGMKIFVPTVKTYLHIGEDLISLNRATAEQKAAYKLNQIKSEQKLLFKIGTVFDISQTTCPVNEYPKYFDLGYSSQQHSQLFDTIKKFCEEKLNCPVYEDAYSSVSMRGFYNANNHTISISGNFNDTTKLSILSHEVGHALLHNETKMKNDNRLPSQIEFEADSVHIMLCSYFKIDIPESRLRHLSESYSDMMKSEKITIQDVNNSLDRSHQAYREIVSNINQELSPALTQTNTQAATNNNYGCYVNKDGTVDIGYSGSGSETELIVPNIFKGHVVTRIANQGFSFCKSLESVTIPDSVTSIGAGAFSYCTNLKSIRIPDSVTYISNDAFYNCSSLKSIIIPDGVKSIDYEAFSNCTNLKSITISDSVTRIGKLAFRNCDNLTIKAPEGSYAQAYAKENNIKFNNIEPNISTQNAGQNVAQAATQASPQQAATPAEPILPNQIPNMGGMTQTM